MRNYEIEEYRTLEDKELAECIKNSEMWDPDLCEELIRRASVWDETIEEDWQKSAEDFDVDFEAVLGRAAKLLGVEIF